MSDLTNALSNLQAAEAPRQTQLVVKPQRNYSFLARLPISIKMVMITAAFTLPILLTVALLVNLQNRSITFAAEEIQGVEYLTPVSQLLEQLPEHRSLTNRLLNNDGTVAQERNDLAQKIEASFEKLAEVDQRLGGKLQTTERFNELQQGWQALSQNLMGLSAAEAFEQQTTLIEQLIALITQVGNTSKLILDPDLDSYYAMDLAVIKLPVLINELSKLHSLGAVYLTQGSMTAEQRDNLLRTEVKAFELVSGAEASATFIGQANPSLAPVITPVSGLAFTVTNQANILLDQELLSKPNSLTYPAPQYFAAFSQAITNYAALYRASLSVLDNLLVNRIQTFQREQLVQFITVALVLSLTLVLVGVVTQRITGPIAELANASNQLSKGNFDIRVAVESADELGTLTDSFNNSILQLREANERQEAEIARGKQLQNNIGDFLNVAMDIAQGDLTKRGQVSEDALGNVVDAINFMTEELAYVLKGVQDATASVNQGATDMFSTADTIAQSAQIQAVEAQKAREDVQGIRSTMRQVSAEMTLSAESANQALNASREGQEAVVKTLEGMQDIRREVQAVSKRVKNLGDRSLEISEIVETISRISEQTNLLAVNAAIESSGAGEAGLRFGVVADQVRKLAEDSAYAAERVSILIKTVQDEVQEVITGVEAGTREVEEGYRVASQAGQRLEDIATIVERSAALAQRISNATQEQVSRVEQVGQVVEYMAEISEQSQNTVSQGREAAQRLQQLATQLSENLSRFRLA
jgi:twitching motility protein PilJ